MDAEPLLNVRGLSVAVSIPATPALPPAGRAMEAAVMGKSLPPNVLLIWIRRRSVPIDKWRVWRSVASLKTAPPPVCFRASVSHTRPLVLAKGIDLRMVKEACCSARPAGASTSRWPPNAGPHLRRQLLEPCVDLQLARSSHTSPMLAQQWPILETVAAVKLQGLPS